MFRVEKEERLDQNDTILVRFYELDGEWGRDGGTYDYMELPVHYFEEEEDTHWFTDEVVYKYKLPFDTFAELTGKKHPQMTLNYEIATEEDREKELDKINEQIEELRTLKERIKQ